MAEPSWRDDLEGLIDSAKLDALEMKVTETKARVASSKRWIVFDMVIIFVFILSVAVRFLPWLKLSDIFKTATAILAFELAAVTFMLDNLPVLSKNDVDQIIGITALGSTYAAIKSAIGDGSKYQKGVTWVIAVAVFIIAMLGFIFPDPPKP